MFAKMCLTLPHLLTLIRTALASFFSFITVAEGGGKRAIAQKFQEVYIPALKANYMVWPAVQLLNFRILPVQFQIVRPVQTLLEPCANIFLTAFCQHNRYCLDGIPFSSELGRRTCAIACNEFALSSASLRMFCTGVLEGLGWGSGAHWER